MGNVFVWDQDAKEYRPAAVKHDGDQFLQRLRDDPNLTHDVYTNNLKKHVRVVLFQASTYTIVRLFVLGLATDQNENDETVTGYFKLLTTRMEIWAQPKEVVPLRAMTRTSTLVLYAPWQEYMGNGRLLYLRSPHPSVTHDKDVRRFHNSVLDGHATEDPTRTVLAEQTEGRVRKLAVRNKHTNGYEIWAVIADAHNVNETLRESIRKYMGSEWPQGLKRASRPF